ncbi:MAG: FAD-dependent oxidoreductase [Haloarculaceae archaeon]
MAQTFVVVGGDAAGLSAASKAKRDDPDLEVIVFERGEWVSYAACGMPYFVKGEIESLDDLVQVTAEEFREQRDVDLRTGHEVTAVDPDAQTVTVEADGETFEQSYDDLLIATGAGPVVPPFEGIDLDGVFTFQHPTAAAAVADYLDAEAPERVGIIGGGYVGLEMAEAFAGRGVDVHVFEMLPHVLAPFGNEIAPAVEDHLREQGVTLSLDTAVDGFDGEGGRVTAIETDEERVPVDMALVGVGVDARVDIAEAAGIELGESGAIAVDEYGETSAEHVYAAGDCAEATNVVTGAPDHVPLGLTANRRGRAVGATVAGTPTEGGPIAGTAIVKVFDLGVARTGVIDEERAREAGFDPVSVTIEAPSRADYYPGAQPITVHAVGDRDSRRLLGAAMVGREGVKRIDTVATALHAGMTVDEVERLDLAYAPPFSPTWDPVLTAARVLAGNLS